MAWTQKRRTPSDYIDTHKAARVLAAHGGICWICGHDDAHEVDHVIPWAEWTHPTLSVHDASNLAPAHGSACPTCGRECHKDKSKAEAARGSTRRAQRGKRATEQHPGLI
jgi:5-methylcytosine-specific restriction endonuclease McrA